VKMASTQSEKDGGDVEDVQPPQRPVNTADDDGDPLLEQVKCRMSLEDK
jgi:hypothetical protein